MIDAKWIEAVREYELLRNVIIKSDEISTDFEWKRYYRLEIDFAGVDVTAKLLSIVDQQADLIECLEAVHD